MGGFFFEFYFRGEGSCVSVVRAWGVGCLSEAGVLVCVRGGGQGRFIAGRFLVFVALSFSFSLWIFSFVTAAREGRDETCLTLRKRAVA